MPALAAMTGCGDSDTAATPADSATSTGAITTTATAVTSTAVTTTVAVSGDPARLCQIDVEFAQVPDIQTLSPTEAAEATDTIQSLLREATEVAPDEIRDSVVAVREGRQEFLAVIEEAGYDLGRVDQERFDAAVDENFISGATALADGRWEAWNAANC